MPLVDMGDLLRHARRGAYAVCSFQPLNLEFLAAIIAGAERCRAPVILTPAGRELDLMMPAVVAAAQRAAVPVAILCTHAHDAGQATRAVNLGCNAVQLADEGAGLRRDCGVAWEGRWSGAALPPADALASLAIEPAVLQTEGDGLAALDVPLAIEADAEPPADAAALIAAGVSRVGCDAALREAARRALADGADDPLARFDALRAGIAAAVEQLIECWGGQDRAPAVLQDCRPWHEVEHLIVFNTAGVDEPQAAAMMAEGRRVLGAIPGVRRADTGRAVNEAARYRYCWLVRFAHPAVIASYRDHPAHVRFADQHFRPVAGDRISIDYEVQRGVPQTAEGSDGEVAAR